jgi:hypothetical protein
MTGMRETARAGNPSGQTYETNMVFLLPRHSPDFDLYTPRWLHARAITVSRPESLVRTTLAGKTWAYTVPFAVHNAQTIEKLIQCESQGVNISRPDSDGLISDGILQFHRGPLNTLASSTWESFSKARHIRKPYRPKRRHQNDRLGD